MTSSKAINDMSLVSLATYKIKFTGSLPTLTTCMTPKDIRRRFNIEIREERQINRQTWGTTNRDYITIYMISQTNY